MNKPLSISEQIKEAAMHLAVIALASPILFTLADWLKG